MRVLILGATGVLGLPLARAVHRSGHEVVGTSRTAARAARLSGDGVAGVVLDAFDREQVRSVLVDVVVHLLTDLAMGDTDANAHLRMVGTRHVVDAALATGVAG